MIYRLFLLVLLCPQAAVADDSAYLQSFIDQNAPLPSGAFEVSRSLVVQSGSRLRGSGGTVIRLADGANTHVIANAGPVTDVRIEDVTIDGNAAAQSKNTHGIRLVGATDVVIRGVTIMDTGCYGIGFQGGALINVHIESSRIMRTGCDGIDFKNFTGNNRALFLTGLYISAPGLLRRSQAGIDIRGPAVISSVVVDQLDATQAVGIRLRKGGVNGPGGDYSVIFGHQVFVANPRRGVVIEPSVRGVVVGPGYAGKGGS